MIFQEWTNNRPAVLNIAECNECQPVISVPKDAEDREVNICECEYVAKVFYSLTGEDHENDKNSFLFKRVAITDTIVIKLFKDGLELTTITDNTYGTFYDFGDLINPDLTGFLVEWEKIGTIEGIGEYKIVAEKTILGNSTTVTSVDFELKYYAPCLANGTFRFDWVQNGCILSDPIQYQGLQWYNSMRIEGKFWRKTPTLEQEEFQDTNRKTQQIQDSIRNEYEVQTKPIPSQVANLIVYNALLADSLKVNDYNTDAFEVLRQLEIRPTSIEDPEYFNQNTKGVFKFKFTDMTQNIIKRKFK